MRDRITNTVQIDRNASSGSALRRALYGIAFAVTAGACLGAPGDEDFAGDDEAEGYGSVSSSVAIAGPWNPPANVRAAGAGQFVRYDGPPAWNGGRNCSGRLLDGTRVLGDHIRANFGGSVSSYGGYACRQNTANSAETSVHGTGRALDLFVPMSGGAADNTKGDAVANWLILNAQAIGVQYIIWDRADWSGNAGGDKMGAYTGPNGHIDHIHVELTHDGAGQRTPWFRGGGGCSVIGDINARYQSLGGAGGFLGPCLTNELTTPDGIGRFNHFVGGSIYWTPSTGAWEVHGDVRNLWESMGWELSGLGYPVSNETSTPDLVGRFNHFQNGSIYWKPGIGAREVRGDIHAKWAAMGWELGVLGYPTTNETSTPDLVGRFNHFEGGSIYWTPSTGAFEVHGAIRERWTALGWELSALGYPTSDETVLGCSNGRKNTFQGGAIYWTAALGAHEVVGPVLTKLLELGGACGQLGYPTAVPVHVTGGTLYAFERGGLLLTPSGSVVVQ